MQSTLASANERATTGKTVRLFLKDGSLHYQYQRGVHRPDVEVVVCGEGPGKEGPGKRVFLRRKGLDYYETDFTEAPLPL
jgi:hypothetical protein